MTTTPREGAPMRAQQHEVRAWVNASAWDDPAEAERVVEAILASGSDDEAEWVRLAGGGDDDVARAADRDALRREEDAWVRQQATLRAVRADLATYGRAWTSVRAAEREAAVHAKVAIRAAAQAGMPEAEIARVAGVDRMTVRRALGKR